MSKRKRRLKKKCIKIVKVVHGLHRAEVLFVLTTVMVGYLNAPPNDPGERAHYLRLIKQRIARPPKPRKVKHLRVIQGGRP
jgi:hypothetical protein